MSGGFDFLVSCVEERYDYQSARSVAKDALAAAGLKQQDKYSDAELQSFADGLASVGTFLDPVWVKLGQSPTGAPAPAAPAPAPAAEAKEEKKDDKKADDKKADDKKADDKKADDKKADDKKDAKKDDKKDDKKGGKKK